MCGFVVVGVLVVLNDVDVGRLIGVVVDLCVVGV